MVSRAKSVTHKYRNVLELANPHLEISRGGGRTKAVFENVYFDNHLTSPGMPRAFLIRSRALCPVPKKENDAVENHNRDENGHATEVSSKYFTQDSPSVNCVTSYPAPISPANVDVKKSYPQHVRSVVKPNTQTKEQEPARSPTELFIDTEHARAIPRVRKRAKRRYQQQTEELDEAPKKVRKGQPKKTVVYYYPSQKDEKSNEINGDYKTPVSKDESVFEKNYTVEKRHYANERSRYQSHGHANQSHGTSSDKYYSQAHSKQTKSFAMQNNGQSLERGKTSYTRRQSQNNEHSDKNTGLENVMIVEYHSMREQRENRYRNEKSPQPSVTQHSSQGYYQQPQAAPVVTRNYAPVTSSPVQISQPPRPDVQPIQPQENAKSPEPETKVVYVPVYPVSQGPNGTIYEPIPNATPIMAKDTVQVQKVPQHPQQHPPQQQPPQQHPPQQHPSQQHPPQMQQHPPQQHPLQQHPPQQHPSQQHPPQMQQHPPQQHPPQMQQHPPQQHPPQQHPPQQHPPQQQHVPEQHRPAPTMPRALPPRPEVVMANPPQPPLTQQKPRMEYRPYEPQMPQQLTAAPAPQSYQPHPQGHVVMQSQSPVAQVPQYVVRAQPPHPQQYQPQNHQQPLQQHSYPPHQPPVSAPQPVTRGPVHTYRPSAPVPQTYQEPPQHYAPYSRPPQPAMHPQGYPERVMVQPVHPPRGPPPVSRQQPVYQHQDRVSHVQPPRPPPLPSQPQHAEKPALPSPSYPQESANRLLTPRYTPDGPKHEQKFVYAPPPADFMHSPVYRVPNNNENAPVYQHDRAERNSSKTGSKKRKSSYPTHAVLQNKSEQLKNLPSPSDSNKYSRTPSPKETDLRCNERLVKSPHQPSLNKSSLIITPPVSPTERAENSETVTVVVRDQGIQASPRDEQGVKILEHTCYRKSSSGHVRSNSYQSESSEEEYVDEESSDKRNDHENENEEPCSYRRASDDEMYTEDGTVVVHIPHTDNNNNTTTNNNNNAPKKHRSKRGNYRFMCKHCHKGFQWHSHLESHERTHTGEKPFKCPECDRAFCRADGLQCHMLVHNKKRPYKCPHCGKGFTDKIVLEKHIYSHTGVKPFKCEYCGRAFSDSLSIEKHLLVHTGTKPYKCPYCVRSFNDSQMLVRHIRSHTGEKPYKCKHCPMAFSKQSALIIHTRVHTGEKPYQCPHCIKSFSISGNLQRHILIHTGERPYKCSKCPKAFNNPSHLSRHISKLHAPQNGTPSKEQVKYEQFHQDTDSYYTHQEVM